MMSFGWRPLMSCYTSAGKGSQDQPTTVATSTGDQAQMAMASVAAPTCAAPQSWFYIALATAGVLAMAGRR